MGYGNPSLEEVSTTELLEEINSRTYRLERAICPYCGVALNAHTCRFADPSETRRMYEPRTGMLPHPEIAWGKSPTWR